MDENTTMTFTLPLLPHEEAKLVALAEAKGLSTEALVREVLHMVLSAEPDMGLTKAPTRSLRGLLSKYGHAPSAEAIDRNRAEMFSNFARD